MNFLTEVHSPITNWRMIYLRASQSIRARFARSYFGQFWITLSLAIMIMVLGLIWSLIWQLPTDEFLPYLAVGHVIYLFASGTINESGRALLDDLAFYLHQRYSLFLSIYVLVARNAMILLYNSPIILLVVVWSDSASFAVPWVYPLYIFLSLVVLFFGAFTLSLICVYFRDVIPLVSTIMSVAFLMTPVMWNVSMIPEAYRAYVYINPFASILELMRNPLIGLPVSDIAIWAMLGWCGLALLASWAAWKVLYRNAIYWM